MDPMLESFIQESRDNLESAGHCFLELEKSPDDLELMNDLFRSMHTIKGNSGLFDVGPLTRVVHAAEDVLDKVRSGTFVLTPEHIDLFLDGMDQVNAWLDALEETENLPDDAVTISQELSEQFNALVQAGDISQQSIAVNDTSDVSLLLSPEHSALEDSLFESCDTESSNNAPDWLIQVPDRLRRTIYQSYSDTDNKEILSLIAIDYLPDEQCFFNGDDPLLTIQTLAGLQWYRVQKKQSWPDAEELDPFHCNLQFQILVLAEESVVKQHFRYIPDQINSTVIAIQDIIFPEGEFINSDAYDLFLEDAPGALHNNDWGLLLRLIEPLLETGADSLYQCSSLAWLKVILTQVNADQSSHDEQKIIQALLVAIDSGEFLLVESESENQADLETKKGENSIVDESQNVSTKSSELSEFSINLFDTQLKILSMPCPPKMLAGRIASTLSLLKRLFVQYGWQEKIVAMTMAADKSLEQRSGNPLHDFLKEHLDLVLETKNSDLINPEENIETITPVTTVRTDDAKQKVNTPVTINVKEQREQGERRQKKRRTDDIIATETKGTKVVNKTLRVDQERIDALMDLVGELVVAKNAFPFLAKRAEEEFGVRELAKEIKSQYAIINRLSDELQGAMMAVRMVPVSSIFQRFPRLVRDLSRRLDKKIRLVMEGEDTEADKNVIENLADPLIHLVRNSLDHGIETSEQRRISGKPEEGTLILRATPMDDQVIIEIIDDGKGIDPDVIKQKAYEKGIIDEDKLDSISDQEAVNLIFSAGLSSMDKASDLSGRGVGMDVVRTAVNNAGGCVSVHSEKAKGTTIKLSLPLSMAVARVMMVEVDRQSYGISMDHIRETVRIPASSIERIKHNEVIILRDKLIPLRRMREVLSLKATEHQPDEEAVLIVSLDGEEVGLIVDDFHEGIDIIQKPLEGVMSHYPMYAGATLLGDGRVLLILDLKELI